MVKQAQNLLQRDRDLVEAQQMDDLAGWQTLEWLVPFTDGHAIIYHPDSDCTEDSLYGPLVFWSQNAVDLFMEQFPRHELGQASCEIVLADQIISWMDAGIQAIYFIYCDPEMPNGLAASGMSGNYARRALNKQGLLDEHFIKSSQILEQIARGGHQVRSDIDADTIPILTLPESNQ